MPAEVRMQALAQRLLGAKQVAFPGRGAVRSGVPLTRIVKDPAFWRDP
jgi:hypothetical protein